MGSPLLSPRFWCVQDFVCALQVWSLCFPQSCGSSVIKSCWYSKSDSWGFPVPLPDPQAGEPDVRLRTLVTVGELLWCCCSSVCGPPTHHVWDLILLRLCPSYHLVAAFSLSLNKGLFFGWAPMSSVNGPSTASCSFGTLTAGDEHVSFYSTILNWKFIHFFFCENNLFRAKGSRKTVYLRKSSESRWCLSKGSPTSKI